ncbi:YdiU family protein [Clostridium sp.]|uniref:protein adenylyltransferase SelO n=1 Tax=Clostridium sp. TaxID=1506 RepID=UPI0026DCA650|nr:YdiU family protein [Clostridium sp.]MDO5040127.1 YdiU family protein [Clostridium sp.]
MEKNLRETGFNFENSYINLPEKFFTIQNPSNVPAPKLIIFNDSLAEDLGLNSDVLKSDYGVNIFSGNEIPEGAEPIAQAYAGHQFGHFTMLGDGRAVLIGEHITPKGERFDIQLKGSGRTPYSRGGDGKAALGPMLREYIISEAMHGLNIETSRSLAVVTTGEKIIRENYLDGAILTRVAKSHIRVGTFQYISNFGSYEELKALADYTLNRHFKEGLNKENPYLYLLEEVIKKQASLISKWQLVGFIHGVMNTDNVTISGETIDYGPCAFMDTYNPDTVFSSIDVSGRYAYGNQPNIGGWNLARFAESLLPLLHKNKEEAINIAQKAISNYPDIYKKTWLNGMRKKLGIFNEEKDDETLIDYLLSIMYKYKADYTNTFLELTFNKVEDSELFDKEEFKNFYKLWKDRLSRQNQSMEESIELMKNNNPAVIPRNHRVEEALKAATENGDYSVMNNLIKALKNPYAHTKEQEEYAKLPEKKNCNYKTYCGT